jgi:hypothetical protein
MNVMGSGASLLLLCASVTLAMLSAWQVEVKNYLGEERAARDWSLWFVAASLVAAGCFWGLV